MHTFIRVLFFLLAIHIFGTPEAFASIGDKGAALQYDYEIIEQNKKPFWVLQYGDQMMQIHATEKTYEPLRQYKDLIEQTTSLMHTIYFYTFFILCMLGVTYIILIKKRKLLKHPFYLASIAISGIFIFSLYSQYKDVQVANDNLRYYYILLENINSLN